MHANIQNYLLLKILQRFHIEQALNRPNTVLQYLEESL